MATGYTRQSAGTIITSNVIQASDFNNEYNLLQSAFDGTTGHDHSGGTGLGAQLSLTTAVTGILPGVNGGTGVANTGKTITIGGSLTLSGAFTTTLTVTGNTSVTLPTSGTLVSTTVVTLGSLTSAASLATVGTITVGTWNASVITGTYGGTGVNNGSKTITLGGNLTTSGAFNTTFTVTADTNVTLPTSGTLVNTAVTSLSSLATVGTITSGTWSATAIAVNKGGTGQTTANAGFNALSPMTTSGDIIYGGVAGAGTRLAPNATATNKYLQSVSSGTPAWAQVAEADLSFTDVTTNDVSTTKHGFVPKAPNDTTKFLRGDATWATVSSGLVLLTTSTASTSSSVDFTSNINSTYKSYIVEFFDVVPATDAVQLYLRISEDGVTFPTSNYAWCGNWSSSTGSSNADGSGSTGQIQITGTSGAIANTGSVGGYVKFFNPAGTTVNKFFIGHAANIGAAIQNNHTFSGQYSNDTNAIVGIRFLMSSGNITSGTFKLYGIL